MIVYVCPHYADPFVELIFERREEAEQYARVYERMTKKTIEIEEREEEENDC